MQVMMQNDFISYLWLHLLLVLQSKEQKIAKVSQTYWTAIFGT